MPEENKTVDIDTSGPGAEINLQEEKKENEIEVSNETTNPAETQDAEVQGQGKKGSRKKAASGGPIQMAGMARKRRARCA